MKNFRYLAAAAALVVLGAGCVAVSEKSATIPPKVSNEYRIYCQDAKDFEPPFRDAVNTLLKQENLNEVGKGNGGRICRGGNSVLVITDDCAPGDCSNAIVALVDIQGKTLKILDKTPTNNMQGEGKIREILKFTLETLTYRLSVEPPGGCEASLAMNVNTDEEVEVSLADGTKKVVRACRYVSCDTYELACTETP